MSDKRAAFPFNHLAVLGVDRLEKYVPETATELRKRLRFAELSVEQQQQNIDENTAPVRTIEVSSETRAWTAQDELATPSTLEVVFGPPLRFDGHGDFDVDADVEQPCEHAQRIIIFVGPDGTGKTEMSTELSRRTGIPRFKNSGEWDGFKHGAEHFVNVMRYGDLGMFAPYLVQTGASVIMDRGHPCEFAYSHALDRGTDEAVLRKLDDVYASMDTRVIIAGRSCYDGRMDDMFESIDSKMLQKIHDAYLEFAAWTNCKTLLLNVDDEDLEREMGEIMQFVMG